MPLPIKKPKYSVNIRTAPLSPFKKLVQQAIEVSKKLNAAYTDRLSGAACLKEAMALANCSPKQLADLRKALSRGTVGLDHSRASVARIRRELLNTQRVNSIPKDVGQLTTRLRYYCRGAQEELAGHKATVLTLFCVAIAEAAEANPSLFGTADSSDEVNANVAELKARQHELFDKIAASITMEEIDAGSYSQGRTTAATFKGTDVPIAPPDSAGRRLVEYLMSHRT